MRTVARGELQRDRRGNCARRTSYFSRLTDHASFSRLATLEMHRRGVERAGQVVAVNDGEEQIQYHRFRADQLPIGSGIVLVGIGLLLWYGRITSLNSYFDFAEFNRSI